VREANNTIVGWDIIGIVETIFSRIINLKGYFFYGGSGSSIALMARLLPHLVAKVRVANYLLPNNVNDVFARLPISPSFIF
jgi:hypothetical protein